MPFKGGSNLTVAPPLRRRGRRKWNREACPRLVVVTPKLAKVSKAQRTLLQMTMAGGHALSISGLVLLGGAGAPGPWALGAVGGIDSSREVSASVFGTYVVWWRIAVVWKLDTKEVEFYTVDG